MSSIMDDGLAAMYLHHANKANGLPVIHIVQDNQHYATYNCNYIDYAQIVCEIIANPTRVLTIQPQQLSGRQIGITYASAVKHYNALAFTDIEDCFKIYGHLIPHQQR